GYADTTVLPLYQLHGGASIDIAPPWPFMFAGQPTWLELSGVDSNGDTYHRPLYVANLLTENDLGKGVFAALPIDEILQLKDGSVLGIKFWSSFPGIPLLQTATFFGETAYVIQQLPAELAFPTLVGAATIAQETTVDPLAIEKTTSVKVAYKGMLVTDEIVCKWILENGLVFEEKIKGQASGSVIADFTKQQAVHNSVNSRVQLMYSVKRGDKITLSTVQTVAVGTIAVSKLPGVLINNQVNGATIDINRFAGDAQAALIPYPLIKEGHRVWVDVVGGGRSVSILSDYKVTAGDVTTGLVGKVVPRNVFATLANNSQVTVTCNVAYDGSSDKEAAVVFPVTTYSVWSLVDLSYDYTPLNNYSYNGWVRGAAAADSRDLYFLVLQGAVRLVNNTYSSVSGILLHKSFNNLRVGSRYRFSIQASRWNIGGHQGNTPMLSLSSSQGGTSNNVELPDATWRTLSMEFVATSRSATFYISHQRPTHDGNDYAMANFTIQRLT
ncbi:hypothetical protein HX797_29540, partial [Pseudomonas edaphica]|nr:hypothetical protein [Pseudomonas edaphica]